MESEGAARGGGVDLAALFRQGMTLQSERQAMLQDGLKSGLQFFTEYNESRLQLAFSYFDPAMRDALFEILFLLNCNEPALAEVKFSPIQYGDRSPAGAALTANLHVEGAPCGVAGIERLSPVFREPYDAHIRKTFNLPSGSRNGRGNAIVCVQSIGSIGTVGHKSTSSDLDLQVIYSLTPADHDMPSWSNGYFRDMLIKEVSWWETRLPAMENLAPDAAKQPEVRERYQVKATNTVAKAYPRLFSHLVTGQQPLAEGLRSSQGPTVRTQVLHELMTLMKRAAVFQSEGAMRRSETLLKDRIRRIETYIAQKYPAAEIHLFTYPIVGFRLARYSSTLESKESSGSAYELVLNYETLMPGIHITPMIPTHFIFPKVINNDGTLYARLMDYLQFDLIPTYRGIKDQVVDLGNTPDLQLEYVAQHSGAMFWEAFKAASGNLPKATLNLLRYEMLLDPRFLKTIIQLIKEPGIFDSVATPRGDAQQVKGELERVKQDRIGMPNWALLDIEAAYPYLRQDPWWLRYKALKIGFAERNGIPAVMEDERDVISRLIDLAFALHVRISDVSTKPGDTRKFDSPRQKVLVTFLEQAFPAGSPRRMVLEQIFIGEVQAVNRFEMQMREVFKRSMNRVGNKISGFKVKESRNKKEQELWFQYYLDHFEPMPEMVSRTIMHHLRVPRGRLQVGYIVNEGWFFKSLQRDSSVGKRFDTFGVLDALPDEVMLLEKAGFLHGLAYCIINGYYGILNRGTLKERKTALEFDGKHMDLGHRVHNSLAFVRPDMVDRILMRIQEFFTQRAANYMDHITKKREVVEVFAFINLWKFGQMALLYQDNLGTWYCEDVDHPEIFQKVQAFTVTPEKLLTAKPFHVSLATFLQRQNVRFEQMRFTAWVNPHSVTTSHAAGQDAAKERQLSTLFEGIVKQYHGPNGPFRNATWQPEPA